MTKPTAQKETASRRPSRREYVVGDASECPHPEGRRTYLGHQGLNALSQCERCEAILISTPETAHRQPSEAPSADREDVRTEDAR